MTFSNMSVPQSGELTRKESYETSYMNYVSIVDDPSDVLNDEADLGAIFMEKGYTSATKVSGKIYLPWDKAQTILENKYQQAKSAMTDGNYQSAVTLYTELAECQYKDAAKLLTEAQEKLAEQKAQKKRDDYAAAQAAFDNGHWETAIKGFKALGNYEDSKTKLTEATEKKKAADYEKAASLEAEGKYAEAIEAFGALKDYKDSAQRVLACQNAEKKEAYQAADKLEAEGRFIEAYDAFLALGDFEDSYQRSAALEIHRILEEARNLIAEKNFRGAWEKVEPLRRTSPEAEKLYWEANFRENGMTQAMRSEGTGWVDGYGMEWALMDTAGNVLTTTSYGHIGSWQDGYAMAGEGKYLGSKDYYDSSAGRAYFDAQGRLLFAQELKQATDFYQGRALITKADGRYVIIDSSGEEVCELPKVKGRTYWRYVGESMVSFTENYVYGLINLEGKVVVKAKYGDIKPFQYGLTLLKTNKGQALINAKGKQVIKQGKYANIIILGEDMLAVQQKDDSKTLSIVNLKGKEYPKAKSSIDGGWIDAKRQGDVILLKDKIRWWAFDLELNNLEVYGQENITVGYENRIFHCDWGEANSLCNGQKTLAMEGKNGDAKVSPDCPYSLWKSDEKGWVVIDSEGKIIF